MMAWLTDIGIVSLDELAATRQTSARTSPSPALIGQEGPVDLLGQGLDVCRFDTNRCEVCLPRGHHSHHLAHLRFGVTAIQPELRVF